MDLKELGLQKIRLNINDKINKIQPLFGKQGDNNTRGLEVQLLYNNLIVDTTGISCVLIAKDEGAIAEDTFVVPAAEKDIKKGIYQIIYPSNLMESPKVLGELRFIQENKILTSFIFDIDMHRTLVVEEITDSIYEQRLIDVIVESVANEENRIANENERQSNEDTRVESENIRKDNETERISNEDIRKTAELGRVESETSRKTSETERRSQESGRVAAENSRVDAENNRVDAETARDNKYTQIEQDYRDRAETLERDYAPRLTELENKTEAIENNYIWFGTVEEYPDIE